MITPITGRSAGSPAPPVIEPEDAAVPGDAVLEAASDTILRSTYSQILAKEAPVLQGGGIGDRKT